MFTSMPLSLLIAIALHAAAQAQPPKILQIFREPVKTGVEAEYDHIESDTARKCAKLRCPNPYLAVEALSGPKEVWWFNAYESVADKERVAEAWAKNMRAFAVLGKNSKRKARLTEQGTNILATYRQDLSSGRLWFIGDGRFLVITVAKNAQRMKGTVFETDNGALIAVLSAQTRKEADEAAAASAESRVFLVRPSWSHPAEDWIAADPEFWRRRP